MAEKKSSPELQKRYIPLNQFRVDDNDPRGNLKGYGNVKGMIDSYGTLMIDGCYTNCIPALLANGFIPDTHSAQDGFVYTLRSNCGFFTNVKEDDKGLYIEGVYHSDGESQMIRTKVKERLDAGKSMGLSVGFFEVRSFLINAKDYASELPKYLHKEYLDDGLEAAKGFGSIKIMQEINVVEVSLTTTPANVASQVISARTTKMEKSEMQPRVSEIRSDYMGGKAEKHATISALSSLVSDLFYNDFYDSVDDSDGSSADDRNARLGKAVDEFKECVLSIHSSLSKLSEGMGEDDNGTDDQSQMMSQIRVLFANPKSLIPLAGMSNKEQGIAALAAVKAFLQRQISLAELRSSEKIKGIRSGKAVSKDKYEQIKSIRDDITECHESYTDDMSEHLAKMDDFLSKYDPSATTQTASDKTEVRNEPAELEKERIETTKRLIARRMTQRLQLTI